MHAVVLHRLVISGRSRLLLTFFSFVLTFSGEVLRRAAASLFRLPSSLPFAVHFRTSSPRRPGAPSPRRRPSLSHGVHQIRVPWADPGSQFTALFERLVIDWLREASQTVARQLGLSWAEVNMRPELKAGFAALRKADLKTSRAWAIKELFARLWNYKYEGAARKFFKSWYAWASRSRLDPIRKAAKTVKNHIENILTYLKFPITNAMAEGINSKIQWIKYTARGFRNAENFKTVIFFHCGNLSSPHAAQESGPS